VLDALNNQSGNLPSQGGGLPTTTSGTTPIRYFEDGGAVSDPIADAYNAAYAAAVAEGQSTTPGGGATSAAPSGGDVGGGFDASYYLASNPDVAQNWGGDAYSHYQQYGQYEGRSPTAPAAPSGLVGTVTVSGAPSNTVGTTSITPGLENWYLENLKRPGDVGGLEYWSQRFGETLDPNEIALLQQSPEFQQQKTASGIPYGNISSAINQTLADTTLDSKLQADKIFNVAQQYGVTQDDIAKALGIPTTQVQDYFNKAQSFVTPGLEDWYKTNLERPADLEGLKYWSSKFGTTLDPNEISQLQQSQEYKEKKVFPTAAADLSALFTKQFDTPFVNALTQDEMRKFTDIYSQTGGNLSADQRYQEVLKQAALDPELSAIMKAKDPMLYESLTPITLINQNFMNPNLLTGPYKTPATGMYGSVKVDGVDVPILNANLASVVQPGEKLQDFSHRRNQDITENVGWHLGAASSTIARGASALGANKEIDPETGRAISYTGLEDAARLLNIDTSKFQDEFVPILTKEIRDEDGRVIQAAGQPTYQKDGEGNTLLDMYGQPVAATQKISAQDKLYDAINNASKDIYTVTGPNLNLSFDEHTERRPDGFQSVLYKQAGEKLIPISAPQTHGGVYNWDVIYGRGKGYLSDSGALPAVMLAGSLALAFSGAGAALAGSIGSSVTGTAATTAASQIVGGIAVGAATGAVTAALTGGDVSKGALQGGVMGGVGASMPTVIKEIPGMDTLVGSIANTTGIDPKQVSGVISSTLARTLSTAAAGANGEQILNSFGTALASSSIGAASAKGVEKLFAGSFTPEQLAGMARATQLVTNSATTAAMSGKNAEQIAGSVINSLVSGAGSIQDAANKAGTTAKTIDLPKQVSQSDYKELVNSWGKESADIFITNAYKDQFEKSPYYAVASAITSDTPYGYVTVDQVKVEKPVGGYNLKEIAEQQLTQDFKDGKITEDEFQDKVSQLSNTESKTLNFVPEFAEPSIIALVADFIMSGKSPNNAIQESAKTTGFTGEAIKNAITKTTGGTTTGTTTTGGTTTGTTTTGGTTTGGTTSGEGGGTQTGTGGGGGTGTGGEGTGGEGTGGEGIDIGTGTGTGGTGTGGTGPGGPRIPSISTPPKIPVIPKIPKILAQRKVASEDGMDGIYNLMPGMTKARTDYKLAGQFGMADGGSVTQYNPFGLTETSMNAGIYDAAKSPFIGSDIKMPRLTTGVTKRMLDYALPGIFKLAEGGSVPEGHNPQFFSEGGLNSLENRYVMGDGDGTSDSVPAMLANGEFVIPADVVSSLGNGSNDAGAHILDEFLAVIREHKQNHDAKELPPDSKGALAYLMEAEERA